MLKTVLAASALLMSTALSHAAPITISSTAAVQGVAGAAGLSGSYYKATSGSTNYAIANTLSAITPANLAGTFRATSLSYSGSDSSTIISFLGNDSSSYKGRSAASYDLSDGILDMSGYLYVASAGTYTFALNHDDSAQLSVGGQTVISANCCGYSAADLSFSTAGYYAIDVVYSNTYYGSGNGGANFSLAENGTTLTSVNLFTTVTTRVPEPASMALLGIGLVGTVAAARRRRQSAAAAA